MISIVTASQLRRIFERRTNFDLRRLLGGTFGLTAESIFVWYSSPGAESFLTSLIDVFELDIAISSSSLNCLKLDPNLRKKIAEALVPKLPSGKTKVRLSPMELLNPVNPVSGIVIHHSSCWRQSRYSYPSEEAFNSPCRDVISGFLPRKSDNCLLDIHILLNTIKSPSIMNSQASASWIPVCLPKFYPSGFVNAYISFLLRDTSCGSLSPPSPSATSTSLTKTEMDEVQEPDVSLICVSSTNDFEHVKSWCETATKVEPNSARLLNFWQENRNSLLMACYER